MNSVLAIWLLATAVYGFPKDVTSDPEQQIGDIGVEGSVSFVSGGLENKLQDFNVKSFSKKHNSEEEEKNELKKKAYTAEKADGKLWVFLVAGSDGWSNYRHQADICHAYQTLVLRGIPKENIIVMMKDDIATNPLNPYKGEIMNEPNGFDVYEGVIVDYRGSDVTAENFIKVLEGDRKAMEGIGSGRVIESTENDTIFVNYDDHGSYGYVVFPNRGKLSARNLSEAVDRMIAKKRFDKMLIYLEACESGSMVDNIYSSNSSVLVLTASGRYESSWACFCNEESLPCLGDAFSVGWMLDLDEEFFATNQTIFEQFDSVRTSTMRSHVNIYGDYKIAEMSLANFFGKDFISRSNPIKITTKPLNDIVDARDASLYWLKKMSQSTARSNDAVKYSRMVKVIEEGRKLIDSIFFELVVAVTNSEEEAANVIDGRHPIDFKIFDCYENLINIFSARCVDIYKNAFTLRHLYKLYNLCLLENISGQQILPKFMEAIESKMVCNEQTQALAEID